MKKMIVLFPLLGASLSGCMIQQTMNSLENNRQAVDASTQVIYENIQAIEAANRAIEENRLQLEAINKSLKKVSGGIMNKLLICLPLLLLTGCSTVTRMNDLVNASTDSIDANREMVERSNEAIRRNESLIKATSRVMEENRHLLESAAGA